MILYLVSVLGWDCFRRILGAGGETSVDSSRSCILAGLASLVTKEPAGRAPRGDADMDCFVDNGSKRRPKSPIPDACSAQACWPSEAAHHIRHGDPPLFSPGCASVHTYMQARQGSRHQAGQLASPVERFWLGVCATVNSVQSLRNYLSCLYWC